MTTIRPDFADQWLTASARLNEIAERHFGVRYLDGFEIDGENIVLRWTDSCMGNHSSESETIPLSALWGDEWEAPFLAARAAEKEAAAKRREDEERARRRAEYERLRGEFAADERAGK